MFFNNGPHLDGAYSSVDIINPPIDNYSLGQYVYIPGIAYGPAAAEWSYRAEPPTSLFSPILSNGQRLPNGNTLIVSGINGRILEIDPEGQTVWEYINPIIHTGAMAQSDTIPVVSGLNANLIFRATRYATDFAGFAGKDLTPQGPLEIQDIFTTDCSITRRQEFLKEWSALYPNPASNAIHIELPRAERNAVRIYDALGREVMQYRMETQSLDLDVSRLETGWYFIQIPGYIPQSVLISR